MEKLHKHTKNNGKKTTQYFFQFKNTEFKNVEHYVEHHWHNCLWLKLS